MKTPVTETSNNIWSGHKFTTTYVEPPNSTMVNMSAQYSVLHAMVQHHTDM